MNWKFWKREPKKEDLERAMEMYGALMFGLAMKKLVDKVPDGTKIELTKGVHVYKLEDE